MGYDVVSETAAPSFTGTSHPVHCVPRGPSALFGFKKKGKKFQGQSTFSHLGPVTWNKLPYYVRYAATKSPFKTHLKTTLVLSAHGPNS